MSNRFHEKVKRRAGGMVSAGYALNTISDLLGRDGCEHDLTHDDINGLLHVVHALGSYVTNVAFDLYGAADDIAEAKPNEK